jgi:hypothetical protein
MLGKLFIPTVGSPAAVEATRALLQLVGEAQESRLVAEASTRNALSKLNTALTKQLGAATDASGDAGSSSGSGTERADAEEEADATLTPAAAMAVRLKQEKDATSKDGDGEDHEDLTDITMTTNFVPDAEGTRLADLDEADDHDDDLSDDGTVVGKVEKRTTRDGSLVDSLLDSDGDI